MKETEASRLSDHLQHDHPMVDLFTQCHAPADYPEGVAPELCDLFERLSLEVVARGFTRYSARAVIHRIRWEHHIERGDMEFKVNNDITPRLARWFIGRHPDKKTFFETRERRDD